jgi:outer membrane protein, multidrug efflux system
MISLRSFTLSSALLLFTGCTALDTAFTDNVPVMEAIKPVETQHRWWSVFQDPLMDKLADEVLSQNLDIQIAQQQVAQSRAVERIANAGLFPEVTATGSATRGNETSTQLGSIAKGGFDTSWEIDIFGKTSVTVDAANQRTHASMASAQDITNSVIAEMIRAVIDYRAAQQTLTETEALLVIQNNQVTLFSARASSGLTDSTFLARAEAERAQTATNVPLAKAALDTAQYKIERLLGKAAGSLTAELSTISAPLYSPDINQSLTLSIDTMRDRPDIRAARLSMLASQADLAKAEADLWPTISVQSFFGVQSGSDGLRLASNPIWSLASSISTPVLNFGRLRGAIDETNAKAQVARLSYENAALTALEETNVALTDYVNGINAVTTQKQALAFRKDTVDLASERFARGLTDMTDLTTAQSELNAATTSLISRQSATAVAYVRLQKALGVSVATIQKTSE